MTTKAWPIPPASALPGVEPAGRSPESEVQRLGALMELMRLGLLQPAGLEDALRRATELVARTIGVARVGVWTLTPGGEAIVCRDVFDAAAGRHHSGTVLAADTHADYFRALAAGEPIAAEDARADPRTACLAETYLRPLGIGAMLDTPIHADGAANGVLCLEHVGGPRAWTASDRAFARAVAGLISLVYLHDARTQSEQRLRAILESEPECVLVTSPEGRLIDLNPAGLAMVEAAAPGELRDRPIASLLHPADRDAVADLLRRCASGATGRLQFRLVGLRGTERWAEAHAAPLRRPDGTIEAVLSVIRDVTEQHRAQASLIEQQQRTRMILETVGEGVHGLDAEGRILFDNPAALAMLGWTAEETRGRDSHALIHHHRPDGSAYPVEDCPISRSLRDGVTRHVEDEVFFRKDGTSFPVEYVCTPMRRADGGIAGAVVTFRDISARLKAERLLQAETEILDLISSGAALAEVLDRIARLMEQTLAEARVAVTLVDAEAQCFRHGASPGMPAYAELIDGVPITAGTGTCGAAVTRRTQVITPDTETDPLWHDLRDVARTHGLRACWSTPALDADGRPLACFAVYHDHPRMPTAEELRAVGRGARLVSLAVQRIRAIDALRASETTFREAFRDAATGIAVVAPDGRIQEVNEAFARILGYRPEELRGVDLQDLTPPEDLASAPDLRQELLSGRRQSYVREKRYRTRQGGIVWVRNSVAMRRDAAGRALNAIVVSEDITPQKTAESALRQNQALLQMASRIGQLGGWQVSLPGRKVTWSEQMSAIHDLPPGEVQALEATFNAYVPEHRGAIREAFLACATEGTPWDLELELVTAHGRRIWVRSIGEAVRDERGRIVAVQGALQDISERKRAENRLRESEARFHAVASATADVIWDWDLSTDTIWWSDEFEKSFGYPMDELEPDSSSWMRRLHPADKDRVLAGIRRAIEQRQREWSAEYRFLHKDGSVREIEAHARLILGPDGRPSRFVGGMRDITARKRFERDLRERIKELRCLYRALELTAADTRPVEEICAEMVTLLPASVLHDELAVARIELEGREHRSAGWVQPVSALTSAIRAGGKRIGQVEIGYRVAPPDQGAAEDPFLPEERTLIDTIATHIGRMVHDRRMAETLTQSDRLRAVGELTGGIAHDFNNLLTVILGNAELLAEHLADDPTLRPLALTVQSAAESAAGLTSRLLAFARRQALDPKVTDVARLLAGMRPLLRRTLGEHIEMCFVHAEGLWPILVDAPQLESAILNLCINARDAMPKGGRLTIETANVELDAGAAEEAGGLAPGAYVTIAVSDTGIGMTPEVMARAFDPFFTTKEVGKGSGLGLSMVWGFVKQSQGHVQVDSTVGRGTTVRIYLPRADSDTDRRAPAPQEEEEDLPRGSERILLVEDDDLVRRHVSAQLAEFGYRVVSARNGPEALKLIGQGEPFDLLFTDIVMPGGMNGRQLAEAARRLRPDLKVLFTSGYSDQAVHAQEAPGQGIGLISKPYRRQELARRLREALAARPPATG
ncbi:PAS domain S-box protein [Elioraea sp.]|uniref:PAS domain S-box protein n=1 Tax=Elioraea sp. TaxID=2185103 RepID=UPI00307E110B